MSANEKLPLYTGHVFTLLAFKKLFFNLKRFHTDDLGFLLMGVK